MIILRTEDLVVAAATDVGMRRSGNEDSHVVWVSDDPAELERRGVLLVVADGMGGANAGEVASQLAASTVLETFRAGPGDDPAAALREAIERANARVHEQAGRSAETTGMGTTCTAVAVRHDRVWLGHVGDSRACLVRGEQLHRLTQDHTLVSQLVHMGQLTEDEAKTDPRRNVITRSVGALAHVDVDAGEMEGRLQSGDALVLCSDGLHGLVSDGEIAMIAGESQPDEACKDLITLANERGGPDNITVIVVRALDPKAAPAASPAAAEKPSVDSTQILPAAVPPAAAPPSAPTPAPASTPGPASDAPAPGAAAPRKAPPAAMLAGVMIGLLALAGFVGSQLWGQLHGPATAASPESVATAAPESGAGTEGAASGAPAGDAAATPAHRDAPAAAAPADRPAATSAPATTPAGKPGTTAPVSAPAKPVPAATAPPTEAAPAAPAHDVLVLTRPFQLCTITLDGETSPDVGWVTLAKPAPTRHVLSVESARGTVQMNIEPAMLSQREIVVRLPGADAVGDVEVAITGRRSATVFVDGAQYPAAAPCTLRGLSAGTHSIRVFGVPGPVRREFPGVAVTAGGTAKLQVDF